MFRRKTEESVPLALVEKILANEQARFAAVMAMLDKVQELDRGLLPNVPMVSGPLHMTEDEEDEKWALDAGLEPKDLVRAHNLHELFANAENQ